MRVAGVVWCARMIHWRVQSAQKERAATAELQRVKQQLSSKESLVAKLMKEVERRAEVRCRVVVRVGSASSASWAAAERCE